MLPLFKDLDLDYSSDAIKMLSTYRKAVSLRYFVYFDEADIVGADITPYLLTQGSLSEKAKIFDFSFVQTEITLDLNKEVEDIFKDSTGTALSYNGKMRLEIYLDIPNYYVDKEGNFGKVEAWCTELEDVRLGGTEVDGGVLEASTTKLKQRLFAGRIKSYPSETIDKISMTFMNNPKKAKKSLYTSYDAAIAKGYGYLYRSSGERAYLGNWEEGSYTREGYIYIGDDDFIYDIDYIIGPDSGFYADLNDDSADEFYAFSEGMSVLVFLLLFSGYSPSEIGESIKGSIGLPSPKIERTMSEQCDVTTLLSELAHDMGACLFQDSVGVWQVVSIYPSYNYDFYLSSDNYTFISRKPYSEYKHTILVSYDYDGENFGGSIAKYDSSIETDWPYNSSQLDDESKWVKKESSAYSILDNLITLYMTESYVYTINTYDLGLIFNIGDYIKIEYGSDELYVLVIGVSKNLQGKSATLECLYLESDFAEGSDYTLLAKSSMVNSSQTQAADYIYVKAANTSIDIFNDASVWSNDYIHDPADFKKGDKVCVVRLEAGGPLAKYEYLESTGYNSSPTEYLTFDYEGPSRKFYFEEAIHATIVSNLNVAGNEFMLTMYPQQVSGVYTYKMYSDDDTFGTGEGRYW